MNDIIQSLYHRKSVRVFENRPVEEAVKQEILSAAAQAPTAGNQQLYTILDITNPELKTQLSVACDYQPFIAVAPIVLVFTADCVKWRDAYLAAGCEPRPAGPGDLMLAVSDACIAAQNAVVAAESLGLGSCYIGDIIENRERIKELLTLPDGVFPCAMLVLGYPTEKQLERTKPQRFALSHIVHENGYRRLEESELREMFAERAARQQTGAEWDFDRWITAFCTRKYMSGFSKEMSRSAGEYWKEYDG
ncbi:MAG: nitroreductase family protein [Eubacteriales bacterium]|nr:nitroreductase family protein [Eubacteriales bacterium]